jgi:hypothetical protein
LYEKCCIPNTCITMMFVCISFYGAISLYGGSPLHNLFLSIFNFLFSSQWNHSRHMYAMAYLFFFKDIIQPKTILHRRIYISLCFSDSKFIQKYRVSLFVSMLLALKISHIIIIIAFLTVPWMLNHLAQPEYY